MENRLQHESGMYLHRHARNPVDWYPWGEEAFRRAKQADKPVFLSIGYSTCHRCHVMVHERFKDVLSETASLAERAGEKIWKFSADGRQREMKKQKRKQLLRKEGFAFERLDGHTKCNIQENFQKLLQ